MTPIEIRIELLRKGYSNVRLAEELGRAESSICNVVYGRARSRFIASNISRITGKPLSALWPGKYERARPRRTVAKVLRHGEVV